MSYSIFYKPIFVDCGDGKYLPTIICGDNNVYAANSRNGRERPRDVATLFTDGGYLYTREEINKKTERWIEDTVSNNISEVNGSTFIKISDDSVGEAYIREHYGWYASIAIYPHHTSSTSWKMVRRFIERGLNTAVTVEEILSVNGSIRLSIAKIGESSREHVHIGSTRELLNTLASQVVLGAGRCYPYITIDDKYVKTLFTGRGKNLKKHHGNFYYLSEGAIYYPIEFNGRTLHTQNCPLDVDKYNSREKAAEGISRINKEFGQLSGGGKVEYYPEYLAYEIGEMTSPNNLHKRLSSDTTKDIKDFDGYTLYDPQRGYHSINKGLKICSDEIIATVNRILEDGKITIRGDQYLAVIGKGREITLKRRDVGE